MSLVYQRDASWYDRPNTRSPKKYHHDGGHLMALCLGVPLVDETGVPEEEVPSMICKRCTKKQGREVP